jgi:phosphinothricin acetyltransferase
MNARLAQRADLAAIVAIYNQAVAGGTTADLEPVTVGSREAWFDGHRPDVHPILVAEGPGGVLGWASLSPWRPPRAALRHTAEISYYVHDDHQRRGVGSLLIGTAIAMCPGLGIRNLFAILLASNAPSVRLLEKHGFERWGRLPRVADFGDREVDQLIYGRRVADGG